MQRRSCHEGYGPCHKRVRSSVGLHYDDPIVVRVAYSRHVPGKVPQKPSEKKKGKSLKEKRQAKNAKKAAS